MSHEMVICDSRRNCKQSYGCGGAQPHMRMSCEPCPFDKSAQCITIEDDENNSIVKIIID
jgi:hypothetical protein